MQQGVQSDDFQTFWQAVDWAKPTFELFLSKCVTNWDIKVNPSWVDPSYLFKPQHLFQNRDRKNSKMERKKQKKKQKTSKNIPINFLMLVDRINYKIKCVQSYIERNSICSLKCKSEFWKFWIYVRKRKPIFLQCRIPFLLKNEKMKNK